MPAKKTSKDSPKLQKSKIGFEDVVGHTHIKERLKSIIQILKNPKKLDIFEIPAPKGLLLYGPVSVGKGMLAKAFAYESGLSYLEISGSKLFDLEYIKQVYEIASKHAPSIVILEDIDIKGLLQGAITNVSFSDIAKVLESVNKMVFTIATSETLEGVDPVLTAPQKLDFLLEVSKLDKDARKFFIEKILQKPHDPNIDTERIVRYITGMSAMDLERLGRMAALSVIEQGGNVITEETLIEQINIIKYGHKIETKMVKNLEEEMKMTAYHEAAHAILSALLLPHIKIEQVTISRRSKMLGFVSYNAEDDMTNITKEELFNDVCVLISGRLAKMKKAGEHKMDSGAIEDLAQASINIYAAITTLGMDKELGFINIESIALMDSYFLSQQIEKRFLLWMSEAKEHTQKLVDKHWKLIEKLAKELIEKEIVESSELEKIIGKTKVLNKIPDSL
ncbi:AAA family ATPase [Sulfurovum sp. zt1-1]|uniref:AAA family ATPase n=1 Tax=Sulfurovum zhangzhouensis TaxID=3019067 RepID=A0ABT7QXS7_9BACT|nr:AAA family ATPase [Sulfurovum zhangzhouensis]MDM5271640.1 AAA family ATPase [Sulfurovum zhangzhouensis]